MLFRSQLGEDCADISFVPFAMEEMTLIRRVPSACFAYARPVDSVPSHDNIRTFDISLCNEHGETLAEIKGLAMRALQRSEIKAALSAESEYK